MDKKELERLLDEHTVTAREECALSADEYILRRDVEKIVEIVLSKVGEK